MRKTVLIALTVLLSAALWAEDVTHSFGFQIGFAEPVYRLNTPTIMGESKDHYENTIMNGFKIGAVYDGNIIGGFGFMMGINYTFATGRSAWNDYDYTQTGAKTLIPVFQYSTTRIYNQGEIFVDWHYKFEIAKQTYLILYSGPTIQYGGYKATDYFRLIATGSTSVEMTKVFCSYEDQQDEYLRHLNVTWGVGAGFQYKRLFLRGGYDFGIINPYKEISFNALDGTLYAGDDRHTRGRLDQWQIKIGMYLWQIE
ncbi:MAG: hypothetical protein K5660_01525 [Paludibacteraceae bacterium]|nr:hypothetical protein [Paludibacteraceae bacterium]